MSSVNKSVIARKTGRREVFCAIAALGLAIILWNWRDRISKFFGFFQWSPRSPNVSEREKNNAKESTKNSSPPPEPVTPGPPPRKSADIAPESLKLSSEKVEKDGKAAEPEQQKIGNSAPEATENVSAPTEKKRLKRNWYEPGAWLINYLRYQDVY
uniref:Uncharacterized protein n=1 Tax=Caenorhabditis japonica TaxID=281687 RepID=A0A8R1HVL5_CAEJA